MIPVQGLRDEIALLRAVEVATKRAALAAYRITADCGECVNALDAAWWACLGAGIPAAEVRHTRKAIRRRERRVR